MEMKFLAPLHRVALSLLTALAFTPLVNAQSPGGDTEKKSRGLGVAPADAFKLADGFAIELLHEVAAESEGSWVSLTVDPQGRLIACDQYGGLFRIDVSVDPVTVEPLAIEFQGAQGLLHAFGALYANVNLRGPTGGLWRLTDTNGDDQYDTKEQLVRMNAGSEHGPHAIILSPDGERLIFCAGNNTDIPQNLARSRVPQVWGEDHLLGRMPDARGHNADRMAPGGFVISLKPDGSDLELVAVGFRNHYDLAINRRGDLFTFDADMEWDVGTPWYRPTRVNHVVSGVDFGWRNGTGKWPEYYADSFGTAVDIGPGSPTGIVFGYGAKFPAKYQNALFLCDWSYGNIYAVHLDAAGSTYGGSFETFATAAPLPATDLVVHPGDGAMYLTVGGRKTQSGLYRIRYVGEESTEPADAPADDADTIAARELRRSLEGLHTEKSAPAAAALANLGNPDRGIRSAARVALEHRPVADWASAALSLDQPHARITAVVALARTAEQDYQSRAIDALTGIDWASRSQTERLDLLRAYALVFLRLGTPTPEQTAAILAQLDDRFPSADPVVNRELAQVLIYLGAPDNGKGSAVERTVALMKNSPSQEDQIHYAMALRDAKSGWTGESRLAYFGAFVSMAEARGGMSFGGFLDNIRKVAIENLPNDPAVLKDMLADVFAPPKAASSDTAQPTRPTVKVWTVDDLADAVADDEHGYDFEQGKRVFAEAQCYKCHRMGLQGGILGPDLTAAGRRFTPRDLLVSTLEPSKEISDQYGATQFLTEDGQVVVGRVINMNANNLMVLTNMLDPSSLTTLNRDAIDEARPATTSMMPAGLLDTFTREEIVQLMGYLRAGGRSDHPLYGGTVATN